MSDLAPRIARGRRAAQFLADPDLEDVLRACEDNCTGEWRRAGTLELREAAHNRLGGIELFRRQLRTFADDGKLAELEVERSTRAGRATTPQP